MATKKASKSTKRLKRGKNLEATKPLTTLTNACCNGTHIKQATISV